MLYAVLDLTCVSVYPYQIGLDNEEAIESGAFWFYRKLGFRPGRPELLRIAEREERKIAAMPLRTSARTLRRLATGHLFLELPGTERGAWDRFGVRNIGFAVQRLMATRYGGDAARFRAGSAAAVARALGVQIGTLRGAARKAFEEFAPVLALVPGLGRWTAAGKARSGPDPPGQGRSGGIRLSPAVAAAPTVSGCGRSTGVEVSPEP